MDEHDIIRRLLRRITQNVPASAPLATALVEWAQPHWAWLTGDARSENTKLTWKALRKRLDDPRPCAGAPPDALQLADDLAGLLGLQPVDRDLLAILIACDRLPRIAALVRIAVQHGHDLVGLVGAVASGSIDDAGRIVRRSAVMQLGLIGFRSSRTGDLSVDVEWTLERLLDRGSTTQSEMVDLLVGKRQAATLSLDDFAAVTDADFLVRLLAGAVADRAAGINILIHGPPGTGKTELARTLADAAGLALHAVGEADHDGEEPTRDERVNALRIAQRLLVGRGDAVLLFDEMEDLIGSARPSAGDWFAQRDGSKVFVNRLLETNAAPVIWTTNAIGNIDSAIIRRMSFVLKLDVPTQATAKRMLDRIAQDEGQPAVPALTQLVATVPETASVLRVAIRAARLAGEANGVRPAQALVTALRGTDLPDMTDEPLDLDLYECDQPIAPLIASIAAGQAHDVSLLLTGPPGTGKTALAHHFARALDRPLLVKRASDLLSKWVGDTEAQIADAFREARQRGGVLLLDEVDSLLFDRRAARATWEVTQVNELLTWLDRHPLPVIAATNHPDSLDPATLRRFVFKLRLRPLGVERSARAFQRFFGMPAPIGLGELRGLTPGDFAVVARQLRYHADRDASCIVELLRQEVEARPELSRRVGFG